MSNETEESKNEQNGEENSSRLAAELHPTVHMTGLSRYYLIRTLNQAPAKGGIDAIDALEDVLEALEQMGPGGPDDYWDWESMRSKGVRLEDERLNKEYPIKMRKKDWRKLVENIRTVVENPQLSIPFEVSRQLTKIYKAVQKVI